MQMSKRSRLLFVLGVLAVFVLFNCLFVERIENIYTFTIQFRVVNTASATVVRASNRTSTNETATAQEIYPVQWMKVDGGDDLNMTSAATFTSGRDSCHLFTSLRKNADKP